MSQSMKYAEKLKDDFPHVLEDFGEHIADIHDICGALDTDNRTLVYHVLNQFFPDVMAQRHKSKQNEYDYIEKCLYHYVPYEIFSQECTLFEGVQPRSVARRLQRMIVDEYIPDIAPTSFVKFETLYKKMLLIDEIERNIQLFPEERSSHRQIAQKTGMSISMVRKVWYAVKDNEPVVTESQIDLYRWVKTYYGIYRDYKKKEGKRKIIRMYGVDSDIYDLAILTMKQIHE